MKRDVRDGAHGAGLGSLGKRGKGVWGSVEGEFGEAWKGCRRTYHFEVFEGPGLHAPAAVPGREGIYNGQIRRRAGERREHGRVVMRHVGAIAGHAAIAAVEVGRVDLIEGRLAPVPVGLVARVAALVAQRLLVGPREVTMPRQEVVLGAPVSRFKRMSEGKHTVPWIVGVC